MIADSLKRRQSGFDSIFLPPAKRRLLSGNAQNLGPDIKQPRSVELPSQEARSGRLKRRLGGEKSEINHIDSVILDCKRRRVIESVSEAQIMHINSLPQSAYVQSPANGRRGKKKNKNRKKTEPKQVSVGEKKTHVKAEPVDSNFNEANYWRPVLPDIEGELARFLQEGMDISDTSDKASNNTSCMSSDDEDGNAYNSFNFWRDPFPEVDPTAVL